MGAWGPGVFENDYALDLLDGLARDPSGDSIREALSVGEHPSSTAVMEAVAAAEIVLAAAGRATNTVPQPGQAWLAVHANDFSDVASIESAIAALERVEHPGSGLYVGWIDGGARDKYLAAVKGLRDGLTAIARERGPAAR